MGLPGWDVWEVEVTPLLSFETRREHERRLGEALQQQPSDAPTSGQEPTY
jgi:hypothetical protein